MQTVSESINIWENILASVQKRLNKQIFDSWFRPIKFKGFDETTGVLHLHAKEVTQNWINTYYSEVLRETFSELQLGDCRLSWEIDEPISGEGAKPTQGPSQGILFSEEPADDHSGRLIAEPSVRISSTVVDTDPIESSLNQKYKFDTFIVGLSNEFAHAAALGTAASPGKTYNPLYIYGGVGLGKTHLMHAIGHAIKERDRHLRVAYITSEKFMNELISAIRFDKTQTFRDKYRSIDVLLMDDIQFMAGKERTQEEFFHTFNALHNGQKQIVISSDCPPREIPTLEERLHSRFEWGLIADIEPPDLETKIAILKRKAELDGIDLPDEIAFFIASKVKSNIRELEGSLVRLIAISSLRGLPISRMLAQDALKTIVDEKSEGISIDRIQRIVAAHYRLTQEELKAKNNSRHIAVPRQVAMYLCKRLTSHSYPEIGREFGNKHHTTVMHSVEKIDSLCKQDKDFHKVISELIDALCS